MIELMSLIRAVVDKYPDDPCTPSVTLSWLPDRQEWYASVVRYHERFGMGKQVVTKVSAPTFEACVQQLLVWFTEVPV